MKPNRPQNTVDLYFMDARSKLIDVAAFMDRVERDGHADDFRYRAFLDALGELATSQTAGRPARVLAGLSDPSEAPIPAATTKAACGAWDKAKPPM